MKAETVLHYSDMRLNKLKKYQWLPIIGSVMIVA